MGLKKLAVVQSQIEKNKKYIELPTTIRLTTNDSQWFSFNGRGLYHPIGIFDENDKLIVDDISVEMTICLCNNDTPYNVMTKHIKGVYWFQAIRLHLPGRVLMRFAVPGDETIEPLEHYIDVVDEKGNILPAIKEEDIVDDKKDTEPAEETQMQIQESNEITELPVAAEPIIEEESTIEKQQSRRESRATSKRKRDEPSLPSEDDKQQENTVAEAVKEEPLSVSVPVQPVEHYHPIASLYKQASAFFKAVQSVPECKPLAGKHRLHHRIQPREGIDGNSTEEEFSSSSANVIATTTDSATTVNTIATAVGDVLVISNATLSLKLSPELWRLVLDDQAFVSPFMCAYFSSYQAPHGTKKKRTTQQIQREDCFQRVMSPSVYDLLHLVDTRCSKTLPHSQSNHLTKLLLYLFETLLTTDILYAEEIKAFRKLLDQLTQQKMLTSRHFGPYYFLRFLVAVTRSFDGEEDGRIEALKQANVSLVNLQKMLDMCVKVLEENAPHYFI